MYQAVISHWLISMQIHTSRCLPSVYQLMRPVDADTTLQSDGEHKSRKEQRHKACLFCWGPMLIKPLVPFQKQNMNISISAMRYEFVFVFSSSFVCVLCPSTKSGYHESLFTCRGVLSSVWCCTPIVFFLPHVKGNEVFTQTSIFFLYTLNLCRVAGGHRVRGWYHRTDEMVSVWTYCAVFPIIRSPA